MTSAVDSVMLLVLRGRTGEFLIHAWIERGMTFCSDTVPLQARSVLFAQGRQNLPRLPHELSKQHRLVAELARTAACQSRVGYYSRGRLWPSERGTRLTFVERRWYSSGDQHYRKCRARKGACVQFSHVLCVIRHSLL